MTDRTADLDLEARLELQGFDDWLRNDPGRRLAAVEARLAELEERPRRLEAAQAAAGA